MKKQKQKSEGEKMLFISFLKKMSTKKVFEKIEINIAEIYIACIHRLLIIKGGGYIYTVDYWATRGKRWPLKRPTSKSCQSWKPVQKNKTPQKKFGIMCVCQV